jgi:hypothetical protein
MMSYTISGLNLSQTVFSLFYAIFWGLVANGQIRWKSFDWPLAIAGRTDPAYAPSWERLKHSFWYLSVVPILLYLVLVTILTPISAQPESPRVVFQLLAAVVTAQAAFAPYRLWLARMEATPGRFFYPTSPIEANEYSSQPWQLERDRFHLDPKWAPINQCVAWMYIGVGALFAILGKTLG